MSSSVTAKAMVVWTGISMVTLLSFIKQALSFRKTCRSVQFDEDFERKYLLINHQHVAG